MPELIIVQDVVGNAEVIFNRINLLEKGFRAVAVAYDEHIHDKESFKNINRLRDSIGYRLFATREQYMIFTVGIRRAESEISQMVLEMKDKNITPGSQTFVEQNNETQLSSYFDNIIFNLVSAFDYFGHLCSYCLYKRTERTYDWDKLVKKTKSDKKFQKLNITRTLDQVNRDVVQRLIDYRSRLIHRTRDRHKLIFQYDEVAVKARVNLITSSLATKSLKKLLFTNYKSKNSPLCSLNYTISQTIHSSLDSMELALDSLYEMILENSDWPHSAYAEPKDIFFFNKNSETNLGEPTSKKLWSAFKASQPKKPT